MASYHGQQPGHPPSSSIGPSAPPGLPEIESTTLLCKWGQDIVQDINVRTSEIFSLLKIIVPPSGNSMQTQILDEKKAKIAEHMKMIEIMFKKLKIVYDEVIKQSAPYEYITVDSLIPYKEGPESGAGRTLFNENKNQDENLLAKRNQLAATLKEKNQHLKIYSPNEINSPQH